MKLACSDYTFPLLDHEEACALIASLGFAGVNIGVWGSITQLRADKAAADPSVRGREVAERLARHGLVPADVFLIADPDYSVLAVNHPSFEERERSRERFQRWIEFADAVGANGLTILPGLDFDGIAHEDSLLLAADELAVRVQEAQGAGLEVSVEPHIGSVVASPEDTARLVDLCPGLGLTLDHSHFVMQGYAVPELDPLFGRVRHLHARGARPDRLQVGMKNNEIDYEYVVGGLQDAGFDGFLITEYLWIDQGRCDECDTLSETILMRDRLVAAMSAHPSS
ncbi:Sugar phosphate isomerase/epimerase [Actinomadura meyerae]|uniref:Sugar phosphate isomerase/epimerase n=1 Tax=Actinomadura meyerae TaxID=240840 RepID=A0A239P657_9ACTN|nr:sugar phosphate isomerase/epimerase [Actinomadura meyerae]SNT62144.1 Sugar phosphate isomerase/epimerase [Actinomadura meyerae]